MAAEYRFVVFIYFNRIVGILKDNATTQNTKLQQKKVFNNYNLSTIRLTIKNLRVYSYELQAKSDKLQFPSMFIPNSSS